MATIYPIKNDDDLANMLARIDELWPQKDQQPVADEIEVLSILVSDYESKNHPIPQPSGLEAIRFRMDQLGINQSQLADTMGVNRSRVSELLSGRRQLTIDNIKSLRSSLHLDLNVLMDDIISKTNVERLLQKRR